MARFATGIAGTPDDTFLVKTVYWNGNKWETLSINNYETTGFLSPEQCQDVLEANKPNTEHFDDDADRFLKKANAINKTLDDNGIAVGDRAKVLGALLLALAAEGTLSIHKDHARMIEEVNGQIALILRKHKKEDFTDTIKLSYPSTSREAVVDTLQHLREMNVRSAINSGDDALGKFYETFLKYANGAKEMGIVLTPRHITKFATEVLGVTGHDKVYDPACGTGGFLVSAMDHVRRNAKSAEYAEFQREGLYGVEKESPVYGLALVNMIFRGDGKSGLQDGNCFDYDFWWRDEELQDPIKKDNKDLDGVKRQISRVMMNPPFKREDSETKFVDHALEQCKKGALLFAVLPYINIGGSEYSAWRKNTLDRHTVKAIIKFDKNLFYPIQEGTYALILEAHKPHDLKKEVLMAYLFDDESRPRLSKMLSTHHARDNVDDMTERLQKFLLGKPLDIDCISREMIKTTINSDNDCSYCPEAYIQSDAPEVSPDIVDRVLSYKKIVAKANMQKPPTRQLNNLKKFPLMDFIKREQKPTLKALKNYPDGRVPVVSATADENGIAEWKEIPSKDILSHLMSISKIHNTKPCQAFWHPYDFAAINTVFLLEPIVEFTASPEAMLYLCQQITDQNAWRYDYARTVLLSELEVYLPVKSDGSVDFDKIVEEYDNQLKDI